MIKIRYISAATIKQLEEKVNEVLPMGFKVVGSPSFGKLFHDTKLAQWVQMVQSI